LIVLFLTGKVYHSTACQRVFIDWARMQFDVGISKFTPVTQPW
jgi:hypothetical protein